MRLERGHFFPSLRVEKAGHLLVQKFLHGLLEEGLVVLGLVVKVRVEIGSDRDEELLHLLVEVEVRLL